MDSLVNKLIVKAAYAWHFGERGTRQKDAVRQAILRTYGVVAADVLDFATAPFGFELAIREAAMLHPLWVPPAAAPEHAAEIRAEWEALVIRTVRSTILH